MLLELALGLGQPPAPATARIGDLPTVERELRRRRALELLVPSRTVGLLGRSAVLWLLVDSLRLGLSDHLLTSLPAGLRILAYSLGAGVIAQQLLAGLAQELPPPLRRAQLLGQLITPRLAQLLILGLVGRPDPGQNLAGDLLEVKVDIRVRRCPRSACRRSTPPPTSPIRPCHTASTRR